jgi:alkanesulfonate monooxygenase SsuD/methylene tetrahydromethanopterin reductase-like flavin-dependent oxidoreductase (luciferase family)
LIQRAEEHGFRIAEHHFTTLNMDHRRSSPRRRRAVHIAHPAWHHGAVPAALPSAPVVQDICMIDRLSHGRLVPGVGRGVRDVEHEWFGSDTSQTRDAYDEILAVVFQALSTDRT